MVNQFIDRLNSLAYCIPCVTCTTLLQFLASIQTSCFLVLLTVIEHTSRTTLWRLKIWATEVVLSSDQELIIGCCLRTFTATISRGTAITFCRSRGGTGRMLSLEGMKYIATMQQYHKHVHVQNTTFGSMSCTCHGLTKTQLAEICLRNSLYFEESTTPLCC